MYAKKQQQEVSEGADLPHKLADDLHSKSNETIQCRFSGTHLVQKAEGVRGPATSASNQTGMPDRLKSGLENLSGYDLSSVRVHYNSPKPQQIGALAYTQGTNIYVGPGQQKHLPHEGWHAVQQLQGRVKPTQQYQKVSINADSDLEYEADIMGKKAANHKSIKKNNPFQEKSVTKEAGFNSFSANTVQRSVGLEIESEITWQAYDSNFAVISGQHFPLYEATGFRLETELSGKLEFVIEPPCDTTDELLGVIADVVRIAKAIESAHVPWGLRKRKVRDDSVSEDRGRGVQNKENLFLLRDVIPEATDGVYISKGSGRFDGGFQATVGVHLSSVPFLMERIVREDLGTYLTQNEMKESIEKATKTRQASTGLFYGNIYSGISPELEGLLNLIYYYIFIGREEKCRPFPKGMTQVMARTNFGMMLSMTPEAVLFENDPGLWTDLVCNNAGINPERQVFCGTFGDKEEYARTINIKIGDWLDLMTQSIDILTTERSWRDILKSMGNLSRADDLGGQGDHDKGVIVELRGFDFEPKPINQWKRFAYDISTMMEQLNSPIQDRNKARNDVMCMATPEVLDDVYKMAIDAFESTFNAKVVGLIKRAKERVLSESNRGRS